MVFWGICFIILSGAVVIADVVRKWWLMIFSEENTEEYILASVLSICLSVAFNVFGAWTFLSHAMQEGSGFEFYKHNSAFGWGCFVWVISLVIGLVVCIGALSKGKPDCRTDDNDARMIVAGNIVQWGFSYFGWVLIFLGVAWGLHR